MQGISISTIAKATAIDKWFLTEIQELVDIEKKIAQYKLDTIPVELLRKAKQFGFSDQQISLIMQDGNDEKVFEKRKAAGIHRVFKMVDTCSAEFEAKTPYFYSTFENGNISESVRSDKKKIIVLGSEIGRAHV